MTEQSVLVLWCWSVSLFTQDPARARTLAGLLQHCCAALRAVHQEAREVQWSQMSSGLRWALPDFSATKVHFSLVGLASNTEAELWDCVYTLPTPHKLPPTDDSYLNQFMDPNGFLIPSFLDDSALMTLQHPLMTKELVFFFLLQMVVKWCYEPIISSSFISWHSSPRTSFPQTPSLCPHFLPPSFLSLFLSFFFLYFIFIRGNLWVLFLIQHGTIHCHHYSMLDCPLQVNT